jgi:hypothetical protein
MSGDARFEEGAERPLSLKAFDGDGLQVMSTLVQDSVFPASEMAWERGRRRFALLLNRFRWEDKAAAERQGRPYERVRSVLAFEDVERVASLGIAQGDPDTVLSLLAVTFEPGPETTGIVELTLAGDGAVRLSVEALEATLRDVTRPYAAPSGKAPEHG